MPTPTCLRRNFNSVCSRSSPPPQLCFLFQKLTIPSFQLLRPNALAPLSFTLYIKSMGKICWLCLQSLASIHFLLPSQHNQYPTTCQHLHNYHPIPNPHHSCQDYYDMQWPSDLPTSTNTAASWSFKIKLKHIIPFLKTTMAFHVTIKSKLTSKHSLA